MANIGYKYVDTNLSCSSALAQLKYVMKLVISVQIKGISEFS